MDTLTISYQDYTVVPIQYATTQIPAPNTLAVTPVVGGGTFAANTYYWVVTATTALGETTVSNEASAAIALNGSANLTWVLPLGVVSHIKVYRGTAPGAENALIATLGAVTAYTDTGSAGSAATPPVANTASVQDTQLYTGPGVYLGYSLSESSGTAAASLSIQDTSIDLAEVRLPQATSDTKGPNNSGTPLYGRVNVHLKAGTAVGLVYVGIPC